MSRRCEEDPGFWGRGTTGQEDQSLGLVRAHAHQLFEHPNAIHTRHHQVRKDEIETLASDDALHRGFSTPLSKEVVIPAEDELEDAKHSRLIVNDQNSCPARRLWCVI